MSYTKEQVREIARALKHKNIMNIYNTLNANEQNVQTNQSLCNLPNFNDIYTNNIDSLFDRYKFDLVVQNDYVVLYDIKMPQLGVSNHIPPSEVYIKLRKLHDINISYKYTILIHNIQHPDFVNYEAAERRPPINAQQLFQRLYESFLPTLTNNKAFKIEFKEISEAEIDDIFNNITQIQGLTLQEENEAGLFD